MRARIRLGEFLQDHDPLRKGTIEATKFRTTLYAQKLQLTTGVPKARGSLQRCSRPNEDSVPRFQPRHRKYFHTQRPREESIDHSIGIQGTIHFGCKDTIVS